jgi:hypothetical protein
MDLGLNVVDSVAGLHIKSDGFYGECLGKNLNTYAKKYNKVQGRLLLNVVIIQCSAILKLLSGKDETLLVRGGFLPCLKMNALNKK